MLTTSTPTTLTTFLTTPPAKLAERDNVLLGYYIVGTASTQNAPRTLREGPTVRLTPVYLSSIDTGLRSGRAVYNF